MVWKIKILCINIIIYQNKKLYVYNHDEWREDNEGYISKYIIYDFLEFFLENEKTKLNINKNNIMRNFEYKKGLNIDTNKFNINGICSEGYLKTLYLVKY